MLVQVLVIPYFNFQAHTHLCFACLNMHNINRYKIFSSVIRCLLKVFIWMTFWMDGDVILMVETCLQFGGDQDGNLINIAA